MAWQIRKLVFDTLDMFEQERDARCYHKHDWIPFPFQKHFDQLSCAETVAECTEGLSTRSDVARH